MKKFILFLLSQMVDHPNDLTVDETETAPSSFLYTISAHQDDYGKIIGKEGKIISALRNLAKVIAIKENTQIRIELAAT